MTFTVEQIEKALSDYQQRFWDEEHPDYSEELEEEGVHDIWDHFTYYDAPESVEIPNLGTLEYVDSGTELDQFNDKNTYVIVKLGNQFFKMEGWYDSWGGESGWDGPFYEVVEKVITNKVWEKKA